MNTTYFACRNSRLLAMGVSALLSGLIGCHDNAPVDDKLDLKPPDMVGGSLLCGEHSHPRAGLCVCDEQYAAVTTGGPCVPRLDLEPAALRLGISSDVEDYAICFRDSADYIQIVNHGVQDAAAYKIRLGFFSLGSQKVAGYCERTLTAGTKARSATRVSSSIRECSCTVSRAEMPMGQYLVFVTADSGSDLVEAVETNNVLFSEPFWLHGGGTLTDEGEANTVRGAGRAASSAVLQPHAEVSAAEKR